MTSVGSTSPPALYIDRAIPDGFEDIFGDDFTVIGPESEALPAAVAVLAGASLWPGERMAEAPDLQVISRTGIGFDTVDLDAATERGIVVCNAPESPTVSTAEHTMALLLSATKSLPANQRRLRDHDGDYYAANEGMELAGRTIGVVGYGRIGSRVARAAAALDMDVIVHDPYVDDIAFASVGLDELWRRSDVVTMHCPLTDETREMVDETALAAMKPGAVFVNAARGGVVDQDALVAALESGHLAFVALDVTTPEPLPIGHPLLTRENVVVTPHIASATDRGRRRMYTHAIANVHTVLGGDRPASCVNPEVYER